MDFLKKWNISEQTITKIIENNDDTVVFNFLCFEENVNQIISYLSELGVTVVEELLINRIELFTMDISKIKEHFDNYNIEVLVKLINEDINALNNI